MAEDPKIVLDPPPSEPIDVKVSPDPGPVGTIDVQTSSDPAPWTPHDVTVNSDGPPAVPFDVLNSPDPGPRAPVDVQTNADPAPGQPFNVNVNPDPAPASPVNVAVQPDLPPVLPFQVPTSPDPAPAVPTNVGVQLDPPPKAPFQVPIELSPPPGLLPGGVKGDTSIQSIIDAVKHLDAPLGAFLSRLTQVSPISVSSPGAGALDPVVLANWFRDYTNSVGPVGVARFIEQQSILYAMNPVVARIFDPTYFFKMMIPGSSGHIKTAADVEAGVTAETVARANDQLLQQAVNANPDRPGGDGLSDRPDVYGPENTMRDGQDFSVDEMVDAAIDNNGTPIAGHPYLKTQAASIAGPMRRFDSSAYFEDRDHQGAMLARATVKARAAAGIENLESREAALAQSAFTNGVVRVAVGPNEEDDGAVYSRTENPVDLVDDDDARIPLCFTDLRKDPIRNAYRSVYFRPLNLSFNKSISPEWNEASSIGRVDPIVGYQRTSRTYNVSWELHAFAPEDLQLMYYKMNWLDSMCYPSFAPDSLLQSGPVIRLRIGDAVATENGGLSGIIKSLSFDFSEVLWELKKGFKVPRSFKVSVDFLALHEGPVGLMNGTFGAFKLPTANAQDNKGAGQFTNFINNSIANAGRPANDPNAAQRIPGGFSKFGEPRRK